MVGTNALRLTLIVLLVFPLTPHAARMGDIMDAVIEANKEKRICEETHPDAPHRWCDWKFNHDHFPYDDFPSYKEWIREGRR